MRRDSGFTLIELLIVVLMIAILAAIGAPALLRARVAANESSAIASIRTISSAQTTYAASCGGGGYAQSLDDLGTPPVGSSPFLGGDISSGNKSGYTFVISALAGSAAVADAADTCNAAAEDTVTGYHAGAVPLTVGVTGVRSFANENGNTIYQDGTGVAIANPIPGGLYPVQ